MVRKTNYIHIRMKDCTPKGEGMRQHPRGRWVTYAPNSASLPDTVMTAICGLPMFVYSRFGFGSP